MYYDGWEIFFIALFVLLGLALVGCIVALIIDACADPIVITATEIADYSGKKVQTDITVAREITEKTELEFFIFIPVSTGKTTILVPIPIFERYKVFGTREGIMVAIEKHNANKLPLYKTVTVVGHVKKDHGKYVLEIDKVCEE